MAMIPDEITFTFSIDDKVTPALLNWWDEVIGYRWILEHYPGDGVEKCLNIALGKVFSFIDNYKIP